MYWWDMEARLGVEAVVAECFSTFLCPGMRAGCVYFGCAMSLTLVYAGEGVTAGFSRALGWRDGRLNSKLLQRVAIKERIQLV